MSEPRDSPDSAARPPRDEHVCIAHAGDVTDPSGGTDRVTALAGGLSDRGASVTLVVPEVDGSLPDGLDGVTVRESGDRGNTLATTAALARTADALATERGARLQFEHSILAGIGALVGCSDYVLDMHDLAYSRYDHVGGLVAPVARPLVRLLERVAVTRAGHVVVVSDSMREVVEDWGVDPGSLSVVPNGYRPDAVASMPGRERVPGRVSFLGTLHPKVDVDALVAVARLPSVSELCVIGDGNHRERLERLAARADLDALRVTGRLPDEEAFDLVARSEVVVNPQHPSLLQRASSPVKLYYYAALGTPVVATAGPAPARELAEAGAAVLVDGDGDGDFAGAVADLLGDAERRREMAANARQAAADWTWSRRVTAFAETYAALDAPDRLMSTDADLLTERDST
ncbi:glycosyltransferase [Halomarina litorea]|uniref:glycosyltransferase n=1 Tax=Halomarina litorea TaxID=2961595 RepID=UPI0020C4F154|nr:glycosyltransferase [Halomarina sp. BCD28]